MTGSKPSEASASMGQRQTRILKASVSNVGSFGFSDPTKRFLAPWTLNINAGSQDATHLLEAAEAIRETDVPVAFPTETVYGLGASALATRSEAVQAIFAAKGRPADNPLIVHISSLSQLSRLISTQSPDNGLAEEAVDNDPLALVPQIYHSLISRFWPGPLTILLPLPSPSPLAAEVTGSRKVTTFGVRMPSSLLALALIHLADTPLAAPSANASTRPSPTTAQHVMHDLRGKIDIILDGGPCDVGVESTVVDGLSDPPAVLRPGGVSLEMLRECEGWEGVVRGYRDKDTGEAQLKDRGNDVVNGDDGEVNEVEELEEQPRAPGMKYKHYSPRAKVVLVKGSLDRQVVESHSSADTKTGVITTTFWTAESLTHILPRTPHAYHHLGPVPSVIARGLFSALRAMDDAGVDVIFVEAVDECDGGGEAAAIMNRLKKAAEVLVGF